MIPFVILLLLVLATSPPLLRPLLPQKIETPTATISPPTATATATATPDPFAFVPTATPLGSNSATQQLAFYAPTLAPPMLGELPPTFTPTATPSPAETIVTILPDNRATPHPVNGSSAVEVPAVPTPAGIPPTRLRIPRLGLDAPVETVGMIPSAAAPGVFEWEVPARRAAGWLNTSAPLGVAGNTVLDGHHNIQGEVFRDLWALEAGDEITLSAGERTRVYRVSEVLILPEKGQPMEVRLRNASYIQPTEDERLTLITCWPYNNNTHRTVVIAFPN